MIHIPTPTKPLSIKEQIEVLKTTQRFFNENIRNKEGENVTLHLCDITRRVIAPYIGRISRICACEIPNYIPLFTFDYGIELAKKYKFKKPFERRSGGGWWRDNWPDEKNIKKNCGLLYYDIVNRKRFLSCLIKELEKQL